MEIARDRYLEKLIKLRDYILPWTDDLGVRHITIEDFLLERINEM